MRARIASVIILTLARRRIRKKREEEKAAAGPYHRRFQQGLGRAIKARGAAALAAVTETRNGIERGTLERRCCWRKNSG